MSNEVMVRLDFEVAIRLPEEIPDEITPEVQQRAVEAAIEAMPDRVKIYLDGEDKEPAEVLCRVMDSDVTEVWVEEAF